MTIKVLLSGSFNNPPATIVAVEIPDGCRRVWAGALKPGDLFLNRLHALDGVTSWEPADPTLSPRVTGGIGRTAKAFSCLIRPGAGEVDPVCPRCEVGPVRRGWRYCAECGLRVARDGRRAEAARKGGE